MLIESAGIPTISIVTEVFGRMALAIVKASGLDTFPIAQYPGPGLIQTDSAAKFDAKVTDVVVPAVIAALRREHVAIAPSVAKIEDVGTPSPLDAPVYSGGLDEVNEYFYDRGWSDGLPIMPPTRDRVSQFLDHTSLPYDHVLGVLKPENREATVWNCAVNGVMAGCRPEYMPILLAVVEAIAELTFHLEDAGSTPGWEPLICVSGPVVDELKFNGGAGAMRVGRRANSTIGRFLRLFMINVAGLRIPPGSTDMAGVGSTFNVALAETKDNVLRSGWEGINQALGFAPTDSLVAVQSVRSISPPMYSIGDTAVEHLKDIASAIQGTLAHTVHRGYVSGRQYPLLVVNPGIASLLSSQEHTRRSVQEYLAKHCWMDVDVLDAYARRVGYAEFSGLELLKARGLSPAREGSKTMVPMIVDPDNLLIVVAGNPGRNQSRLYCDNSPQGSRVIKRIKRRGD